MNKVEQMQQYLVYFVFYVKRPFKQPWFTLARMAPFLRMECHVFREQRRACQRRENE